MQRMVTSNSCIKSRDGSIGIGAMIVFIALILVAAVASTVIMETIESLQQKGENTGSDVSATVNTKPRPTSITIIGEGDGELFCATENDNCDFVGTKLIRYVSNDDSSKFFDLELTGGTTCTNGVFGDPHVGHTKSCFIMDSKELLLTWEMTPGSLNVHAQDIKFLIICGESDTLQFDSNDMVSAEMTFLDGTNTDGDESAFVENDVIEAGKKYRVPLLLYSCIPSVGQEMTLTFYVDGGGETIITMYFASVEIGHKVY